MIISFDLDDTLIPGIKKFETEKRSISQKLCGIEKIRFGTIELMKSCKLQGHKIYIYTTSHLGWQLRLMHDKHVMEAGKEVAFNNLPQKKRRDNIIAARLYHSVYTYSAGVSTIFL